MSDENNIYQIPSPVARSENLSGQVVMPSLDLLNKTDEIHQFGMISNHSLATYFMRFSSQTIAM